MDVFLEKILDAETKRIGQQQLSNLLGGSRLLDGKTGAEKESKNGAENENNKSHDDVFGDGQLPVVGRDVEPGEERQGVRPEKVIHELRKSGYMLSHSSVPPLIHGMQDFVHTRGDSRCC